MITSKENDYIKHIRLLYQKKYREEFEEYIVEGMKMVLEAIKCAKISKIVVSSETISEFQLTEIQNYLSNFGYSTDVVLDVSFNVFEYLSDTETPQGVLAVVKYNLISSDEIIRKLDDSFFILDRVQDPGNLGTIIRSLDAAGFKNLVLSNDTVDQYNLKTIRSTMGSIYRLKIYKLQDDLNSFIDKVKEIGFKVVATSLNTDESVYDLNFSKNKYAVVMGNESQGVSSDVINNADVLVKIPMIGDAESLNVAVATSIIAFEKVRQECSQKIKIL